MRNPTRRNRNIGTAKQGYGQDNRMAIPGPDEQGLFFHERFGPYKKLKRTVNGHEFIFVVEETRATSFHACTIEDLVAMLQHIPIEDFGDLRLIVLRQPKRKEQILSSVWGRFRCFYEFEDQIEPVIIIEAVDLDRQLKWSKKLDVEDQKEFERLKADGHAFITDKRHHIAPFTIEHARSTQLYRTLPHELGHYVHFQQVRNQGMEELKAEFERLDAQISDDDTAETNPLFPKWEKYYDQLWETKEKNEELFFALPKMEKEEFAHRYADTLMTRLQASKIIPFPRIVDPEKIQSGGLNLSDFVDQREA